MIIYESKKPYKDDVSGNSDPFMFALGCVFLVIMLAYWSGAYLWNRLRKT